MIQTASQTLAEVNASAGPEQRLLTLEISSDAFETIAICNGFTDRTCTTEDARSVLFEAANMDAQLARRNNTGNQTLTFAVDNTTGEVSNRVDDSRAAQARVTAVFRVYLLSNLGAPAEKPYRLTLLSGSIQGVVAQLQMGYFNMIGVSWPRELYTVNEFPGLRDI